MARTTQLSPASTLSAVRLPATGTIGNVSASLAFGMYFGSEDFQAGAVDQVAYTYKKLGGDVLDLEITEGNIYAAYEDAVLEYSYIVNIHQAKNSLSSMLGGTTGSFDQDGIIKSGSINRETGVELSGSDVALRFPNLEFSYARRIGDAFSTETSVGGYETVYSASIPTKIRNQDYDLQSAIAGTASSDSNSPYYGKIGNSRILVKKVYYKTPSAMWRFYGYYGGLNTVGNLQNYGQFADDSQFQIVPVWQNKLQSMGFEDAIYTRNSHYSYELRNNILRIFPQTTGVSPTKIWVEFVIRNSKDAWDEDSDRSTNTTGINNLNTLPFENIPYKSINSIGKQWIRRFALAVSKEMLGHVRSKFGSIPIPGESITLNGADLISQGKEEQSALRDELKTVLDEMTYARLAEQEAGMSDSALKVQEKVPLTIFVG
tara:strand:- start:406 stop:1698 length:1293 start_codon:yes stop_codon:yes gene_type:complete